MKLLRLLRAIFSPMKAIAAELKIIRELYELELSERERPIIRITQKADPKNDTEVTYSDVYEETPGWKKFLPFSQPDEEPFSEDE